MLPFFRGRWSLGMGVVFWCFFGGILGGIGHLDNSPTMVTKRTNFNPGMTRRKCQRRRLGRKSTNIWVSSHPSNKKATSHHTSARNWKIWTQFWQTLFVQQGCKQEKTQTHTQPITRFNLIKNNLPKVFAKKNINLPKVIPHPNQKINTPEFSALILQPSRKPVGDLAPRFREDHPFRPTFPKTPLFKAEKISGSRKEVPLGAGGMEGERFGAAWRSWWKWGSMG